MWLQAFAFLVTDFGFSGPSARQLVTVALKTLCAPGYPSTVRNVPDSLKKQVYAAYGITPSSHMATAASGRRVSEKYQRNHPVCSNSAADCEVYDGPTD
jgi:hypothetical protein